MSSFHHLPTEVVEEIMSWVPADELIRFKRVSKSWYGVISGLIDDPSFVAKHLRHTKMRFSSSLIFTHFCPHLDHNGVDCQGDIFSLVTVLNGDHDDDRILSVIEELNLPPPRDGGHNRLGRWRIRYHSDGIICLVQDARTIMVCNPVLRECRLLPLTNYARNVGEFLPSAMGFGYDSRAKQYKVVAIWNCVTVKVEVHTLGTESWREFILPRDMDIAEFVYEAAVYRMGVCYWVVRDFEGHDMNLCFDMSDEEFYVTQFPDLSDIKFEVDWAGLSVWDDYVALIVCFRDYNCDKYPLFVEIFVMVDNSSGDKGASSWTKQFSIGPIVDFVSTLSVIKNNEFLMQDRDKQLVSYNLHTQKRRHVVIHDVDRLRHWACFYEKSLVSVKSR
ncbi:Putative F-box protein [Morus notabilis]|uniref:Putative F-box protein n=2 Tax=Morus notabilis TaxID=981085 RepID=W9RES4_9ROSA|nr:F-box/kelch-repeat protein At3g23880 [Morus notabilis]XP_010113195.1 F-box/kelch-repeat protein At3g23880 [Morus notabilis]EXB60968.1 Putative F-box protein [Morus notabilis]EXB74686.1 Putative F-box protein [Morus notabilis]EXC73365.1 Putative F-box protein [Morus notabilis]